MAFIHLDDIEQRELVPGFKVRFVHSGSMTLAYWEIAEGSDLPMHSHPHEQIVNVIAGELELTVDGKANTLRPGDVFVLEPDVPHGGKAVTQCRVIDAFHPVREDYR
jgi:quercetin dioxygenase-like cupin family protein